MQEHVDNLYSVVHTSILLSTSVFKLKQNTENKLLGSINDLLTKKV